MEIEQETPDSVWAITLLVAAAERVFKPVMKAAQKGNEKAIHEWGELETIEGTGKQIEFTDPRQPLVPFKRNFYRVKVVE